MLTTIRKLLRVEQWYKNLIIFLPLIFSPNALNSIQLLIGFIGLCAISSTTYIINDWVDREKDRLHPTKRHRPIAAQKITAKGALIAATILLVTVAAASIYLGLFYASIVTTYFIITNLYSFGLKNIPILDVIIITTNFLLRMLAGTAAFPDANSFPYFAILFATIIIFLSHKRRSDIKILGNKASKHKAVLKFYTPANCYIIRLIGAIILATSCYYLWRSGTSASYILPPLLLLLVTSILFTQKPRLTIKPHYLIKNPIWIITLALTIILLIFATPS